MEFGDDPVLKLDPFVRPRLLFDDLGDGHRAQLGVGEQLVASLPLAPVLEPRLDRGTAEGSRHGPLRLIANQTARIRLL